MPLTRCPDGQACWHYDADFGSGVVWDGCVGMCARTRVPMPHLAMPPAPEVTPDMIATIAGPMESWPKAEASKEPPTPQSDMQSMAYEAAFSYAVGSRVREPTTVVERFWQRLGFRYRRSPNPKEGFGLSGQTTYPSRFDFGLLDRLRLLLTGRLHIDVFTRHDVIDIGRKVHVTNFRIGYPFERDN